MNRCGVHELFMNTGRVHEQAIQPAKIINEHKRTQDLFMNTRLVYQQATKGAGLINEHKQTGTNTEQRNPLLAGAESSRVLPTRAWRAAAHSSPRD